MMNQETYVRINDLHSQDWTLKEIAAETGFHPVTIKKHLANGGPPAKRAVNDEQLVMNAHWQARVDDLIEKWPRLLGISVFHRLRAEGFPGGYSTVTTYLREVRGPRFRAADRVSVPIHTDPGEGQSPTEWWGSECDARCVRPRVGPVIGQCRASC